jgi:hypothetical protein
MCDIMDYKLGDDYLKLIKEYRRLMDEALGKRDWHRYNALWIIMNSFYGSYLPFNLEINN